ncbi:MAG: hypothetical protein CSB13_09990 [Chloroflexi bacterium]|nr:MAG: hypothetical protein CSB13_09990 [Chloroflexota bacterium]
MKAKVLIGSVIILLLATCLRFHNLDAQSFWNDEGNSARLSERSLQLIVEGTASDIHPPLYYLLLRGWRELVGEGEFGLRSLSAFAGLVVVAGAVALARLSFRGSGAVGQRDERFAWTAVLLVAGITAVSPPLIYYSQEARMYALLALEAALSTLFMFWWWEVMRQPVADSRWRKIILLSAGYVFFAAAGLYTQYAFPAVIVAQNVVFGIWIIREWRGERGDSNVVNRQAAICHPPSLIAFWLAMMLAVCLLYLPWLPIFLRNIGGGPAARPFLPDYLLAVFRWLAFGHTVTGEEVAGSLAAVAVLMTLGVVLDRGWRTAVWLAAFFIPVLAAYYVGAFEPQLFKMLLVVIAPFAILIILVVFASSPRPAPAHEQAVGPVKAVESHFLGGKWRLPYLGLLLLLGLLASVGVVRSLVNLYTNPDYARADYRGMAAQIAADNHENAGIILNAPNQWEVFTYYHTAGAPVYPLPLSGMSREQIESELTNIASQHERIYVIYWGDSQQDPERIIEKWLDENTYKATSVWSQDVRFVVYAVPSAPATEIETPTQIKFGDHISLSGYTLAETELAPGDILQLSLFWLTDAALEQRYKVFLHVLDENGQLVTQRDSEPGSTLKPTTIWKPDETIIDNHGVLIPTDLPPGHYTLNLGMYDFADPDIRLPIDEGGVLREVVPLGTITVGESGS